MNCNFHVLAPRPRCVGRVCIEAPFLSLVVAAGRGERAQGIDVLATAKGGGGDGGGGGGGKAAGVYDVGRQLVLAGVFFFLSVSICWCQRSPIFGYRRALRYSDESMLYVDDSNWMPLVWKHK